MCGIAGIVGGKAGDPGVIAAMIGTLEHRGPDDQGVWSDPDAGVSLGHRRLAIVDLSAAGHEPMVSASGRFVVTYNGEIYNHGEIRRRLDGEGRTPPGGWRGHSDIETLLEAIDHWGISAAIEAAVGMFAFALWDRQSRELHLVRDRFGEKPLYYGWAGRDFVFASELKAIRRHPDFVPEIESKALGAFVARGYVPAPLSIHRRLFKLEPGCRLTVSAGAAPRDEPPAVGTSEGGLKIERYYDYASVVADGQQRPFGSRGDALAALDEALSTAIDGQLSADVPVGAFLSGGFDSSIITAVYQRQSSRPIHTYSIGFEEAGYDEAVHARRVAAHLGTIHHEHYVTVAEARDVIPLLPTMYDEPFADSSQIPTFLVSRFARKEVTVALTGDGGDELFAGYNRHLYAPRAWSALRRVPRPIRAGAGHALRRLPDGLLTRAGALLPGGGSKGFGAKIRKGLALAATARDIDGIYASFLDEWAFRSSPIAGEKAREMATSIDLDRQLSELRRLTCYDALTYLPDDILCKVDRASMAVSLESRVPFLDHRVAAVAARVADEDKVANGQGKQILRDYLYQFVPRPLVDRPKAGFALPIGEWLRAELRPWAEDLLAPSRLSGDGYFAVDTVRARWDEFMRGDDGSTVAIWSILMFQAWTSRWGDSSALTD